jgi:hypothetical protein
MFLIQPDPTAMPQMEIDSERFSQRNREIQDGSGQEQ